MSDPSKYIDFQKLFDNMVNTRKAGFEFEEKIRHEEEDPNGSEEMNRYQNLFPGYANNFLASYVNHDKSKAGAYGFDILGIFNYLEHTFEVNMNSLRKLNEDIGIVEFSTGNFPFGGLERFIMTLKAFDLIPIECFNGFVIYEFGWTSDYEHDAIELPEKTKEYLAKFKK